MFYFTKYHCAFICADNQVFFSVKLFITSYSMVRTCVFLLFMFRVCHAFLSVHCSLVVTCRERAGLLTHFNFMLYCIFVTFHVVSLVRCGT